ncbi:MAG TPA: hypothetical protein VGK59_11810 [Ohtaekwangia sp.]
MKRRLIYILLSFLLSTFISAGVGTLRAQDSGFPSENSYPPSEERVIYSPGGEGDPIVTTPKTQLNTTKDSIATIRQQPRVNPASEPTKVTKQAPEDDSVLSFNFLYYIIRKYKLQDIID